MWYPGPRSTSFTISGRGRCSTLGTCAVIASTITGSLISSLSLKALFSDRSTEGRPVDLLSSRGGVATFGSGVCRSCGKGMASIGLFWVFLVGCLFAARAVLFRVCFVFGV